MNTISKLGLGCLLGGAIGVTAGCTAIINAQIDAEYAAASCWCGEKWQVQIAGATAYQLEGSPTEIAASNTTYARCVSMLEHVALNLANPQDATYMALRAAFESEAIAKCELAGKALYGELLDHTDCATTGTDPVSTNLVHLGPCWEPNHGAEDHEYCPGDDPQFQQQCGHFYDCDEGPIVLLSNGYLWLGESDGGETGGESGLIPWTGEEELFTCDEPPGAIDGPSTIRP